MYSAQDGTKMPDAAGDYLADLTTAPIFDDAVFLSEVLDLAEGQNEEDLDTRLTMAARDAGIEEPYRLLYPDTPEICISDSTTTVSSVHRSSMSIHSRETQSTGITSHPSRTSKDIPVLDSSPALRIAPPGRSSLSTDDYYGAVRNRFLSSTRHRTSYSVSCAPTVHPSSPPVFMPTNRKQKRGSYGLFSMFRKDSSSCSSRSHHSHHTKPLSPRLECGHTLSKSAIRVHIQDALDGKGPIAPNCCGKPLPRPVLETVLTKEEVDVVAPTGLTSPDTSSLRDSGYSEDGVSSLDLRRSSISKPHPLASRVDTTDASPNEECVDQALADETFKSLQTQQEEQYRRVSMFESNQRKALSVYHHWSEKRLTAQLEASQAEMIKEHASELERLEESQVIAEHEMRKAHAQETQNVATALKYMGAYCSGSNPTNPSIAHTVTEEDRKKLARQHLTQQKLPAKHESAINVLRARQEKETKVKLQKQQNELQQLMADYMRQKQARGLQYMKDLSRLEALNDARRRKMDCQWDLRFETWRKGWERHHEKTLKGRLPRGTWPPTPEDAPLDPSSSLALYLQLSDNGPQLLPSDLTCSDSATSLVL